MGCGPSRVSIEKLRPRRRKSTANTTATTNTSSSSSSSQHDHKSANHGKFAGKLLPQPSNERTHYSSIRRKSPTDYYVQRNSHLSEDIGIAKKRIANKIRPISGPLQPPLHRSSSQIDFFRMLDEKIANGKDCSDDDDEPTKGRRSSSVSSKSHRRRSGSRTSVSGHSRKDLAVGERDS